MLKFSVSRLYLFKLDDTYADNSIYLYILYIRMTATFILSSSLYHSTLYLGQGILTVDSSLLANPIPKTKLPRYRHLGSYIC
jgi:hypothetical protein